MRKALITGVTGQDGAYLARLLLDRGYEVVGAVRRTSGPNTHRLEALGIEGAVKLVPLELLEFTNIHRTIEKIRPDEVYNLGAQSFVALSFEEPVFTSDVTAVGALRLLEAIRAVEPGIRFFQASSSEMFGRARSEPQDENTPFHPRSPYAIAKLFAHWAAVNYRESYGMFACSGILFNHESPLRGLEFVTRKITRAAARIRLGLQEKLILGNLNARRDWGYAPEYVEAMWLMLRQTEPEDFVIATGRTRSVREFVEAAFGAAGIDIEWSGEGVEEKGRDRKTGRTLVEVSPEHFRPAEVDALRGDPAKARAKLGWSPRVGFEELVSEMVEYDLRQAKGEPEALMA